MRLGRAFYPRDDDGHGHVQEDPMLDHSPNIVSMTIETLIDSPPQKHVVLSAKTSIIYLHALQHSAQPWIGPQFHSFTLTDLWLDITLLCCFHCITQFGGHVPKGA
jgi:hypothetical protein